MRKYRFHLTIGYSTADHEEIVTYTAKDLSGKTEKEIERLVEDDWREWRDNYIESYYERVE
jgi:hypothetical protein